MRLTGISDKYLFIISPNDYPLRDLADVIKSRPALKIGIRKAGQAQMLYEQLKEVFPMLGRKTTAVLLEDDQIISGYTYSYHIYMDFLPLERDIFITGLSEKTPSHLMTVRSLNAGNFFITDGERPFYTKYPQYQKALLEKNVILHIYPYLAIIERVLYVPTIKRIILK